MQPDYVITVILRVLYALFYTFISHYTGVRLIHRARNPGCFTSSPQATWISDIDDPPLLHPVSEYSLWYVFISIAFLTCLACLNFSGIGKTLKVLSSRDLFVLPGPSSRFYFGHTNYNTP